MHGTVSHASFMRAGNVWQWLVYADGDGNSLIIHSAPEDRVASASNAMKTALKLFCARFENYNAETSDEVRRTHVEELRVAGRALTKALFFKKMVEPEPSLATDGMVEFVNELARTSDMIVHVIPGAAKQHVIDFCVLNDGDQEFFLGERCLCIHRPTRSSEIEKFYNKPPMDSRIVGYAEDSVLASACLGHNQPTRKDVEEIYVLKEVAGPDGKIEVLDDLNEALLGRDIEILRTWLAVRRKVFHFNCHADLKELSELGPRMRVWSKALVGRAEMNRGTQYDLVGSFVFLNVCSSAIGAESVGDSLAQFFRQHRAGCVACTTGPVNDAFATRFARTLYDKLNGEKLPMMQAMTSARRQHIAEDDHPMALLYTYIGSDEFRLA